MTSWLFIAREGKHCIFRCSGCRRLAISPNSVDHGLGACAFCVPSRAVRR